MIRLYLDFLSPYSYLASALLARPEYQDIEWDVRLIPVGSLMAKRDTLGPGEDPLRRNTVLKELLLLAQLYEIPFEGPPTQPFQSVYALRCAGSIQDPSQRAKVTQGLFDLCWGQGLDIGDPAILEKALGQLGHPMDVLQVAGSREARRRLKTDTQEAWDLGVFGVPSFLYDGLVLFGHDRIKLLKALLDGRIQLDSQQVERMSRRPQPKRIR